MVKLKAFSDHTKLCLYTTYKYNFYIFMFIYCIFIYNMNILIFQEEKCSYLYNCLTKQIEYKNQRHFNISILGL